VSTDSGFDISADGKAVVVGVSAGAYIDVRGPTGRILVHDVDTGRLVRRFSEAHRDSAHSRVAFVGDATTIASTARQDGDAGRDDGPVRLWNVATGTQVRSFTADFDAPRALFASPDGRYLVLVAVGSRGSYPATIRVWDLAAGLEVGSLTGDGTTFDGAALSADGRQLAVAHYRGGRSFEVLVVEIGSAR
jgi:WD40 repeat protein